MSVQPDIKSTCICGRPTATCSANRHPLIPGHYHLRQYYMDGAGVVLANARSLVPSLDSKASYFIYLECFNNKGAQRIIIFHRQYSLIAVQPPDKMVIIYF